MRVEIGHGNRSGNCEPDDCTNDRARAILGRMPLQPGEDEDRSPHCKDTSDDGATEEPGLPRPPTDDGTDDGPETGEDPGDDEDRYRSEPNQWALEGRVFAERIALKLGQRRS
jgi:hypothetical protein